MYVIELVRRGGKEIIGVGLIERNKEMAWTNPTFSGYLYCTKFKDKQRAEKAAAKLEAKYQLMKKDPSVTARVASEFGGPIKGDKGSVSEKQKDKVRR
jgi:hypothetical protein